MTVGVQTAMFVANAVLCVSVVMVVMTVQLYVPNVTKNVLTVSLNISVATVVRVLIVQAVKETSAWVVRCALTVLNISATVETVALNVLMSAKAVQNIAETVQAFSVLSADFVLIVQESSGVRTVITAEIVWMSATAEQVVLTVQMSAKAVLKNAVTALKWIYARNAETAGIV